MGCEVHETLRQVHDSGGRAGRGAGPAALAHRPVTVDLSHCLNNAFQTPTRHRGGGFSGVRVVSCIHSNALKQLGNSYMTPVHPSPRLPPPIFYNRKFPPPYLPPRHPPPAKHPPSKKNPPEAASAAYASSAKSLKTLRFVPPRHRLDTLCTHSRINPRYTRPRIRNPLMQVLHSPKVIIDQNITA